MRLPSRRIRRTSGRRDERGSMAVEIVILTPILMMFIMLIVMGGRYVAVRGDVDAAARDAARAASLERSRSSAAGTAVAVARQQLDLETTTCGGVSMGGDFEPGGTLSVTLNCSVSFEGLGLIGVPGSVGVDSTSTIPLDVYRRYE